MFGMVVVVFVESFALATSGNSCFIPRFPGKFVIDFLIFGLYLVGH